jgi:hypothetical protein
LIDDPTKLNYHVNNFRVNNRLPQSYFPLKDTHDFSELNLIFDGHFGVFGEYRFIVIDGSENYFSGSTFNELLDAVIVSGPKKLDLETITECFRFKSLIIDSSVPYWKRTRLKEAAELLDIQHYDVTEEGAYIRNF